MGSRRYNYTDRDIYRQGRLLAWAIWSVWWVFCMILIVALPPVGFLLLGLGTWKLVQYLRALKRAYREKKAKRLEKEERRRRLNEQFGF